MTKTFQKRGTKCVKKAMKQYGDMMLVRNLLADIRHYCDKHGIDFRHEDKIAYSNYSNEVSVDLKAQCLD